MTQEPWLELPEHVVDKIEKVLGIPPSELSTHNIVKLIEDLCDTALMFDRDERGTAEGEDQAEQPEPLPAPQPSPEAAQ